MLFLKQSAQKLDMLHKLDSHQHWAELVTEKKPKQSMSNIVNTDCAYDRYAHISHATYA